MLFAQTNNLMVEFRGLKKNVANVESYMNERLRKLEARLVNIEWKVPYSKCRTCMHYKVYISKCVSHTDYGE